MFGRSNHLIFTLATCIIIVVCACTGPNEIRKSAECLPPPPPPKCKPTTFVGTTYDTTRTFDRTRWHIFRVQGASNTQHEYGVFETTTANVLLAGPHKGSTSYSLIRFVEKAEVVPTTASNTERALLTSVADTSITGDAAVTWMIADQGSGMLRQGLPDVDSVNMFLFWDGHPTVSADSTVLIFASDRDESIGGTDLFYCSRIGSSSDNTWSAPMPLPGTLNTPCDEICPRFAGDTTLVFSSAGHATVGGYDIFAATITANNGSVTVGEPRNIGTPVNTEYDELFPMWADNTTLYYSSDQPIRGNERKDFDLFVLTTSTLKIKPPPKEPPTKPRTIETSVVEGTVINKQTNVPVENAEVTARNVENNSVVATTRTDTLGHYAVTVPVATPIEISAQGKDLFYDNVRVTVPKEQANTTVTLTEPLALPITLVLRINFPTDVYSDPYEHTLDSNGIETQQSWQESLDLLANNVRLSGNKLKRLVLIGHTDDVGTNEYNINLGNNRVKFVMSELTKRGVPESLMEGRSAGESRLPDQRKNEDVDLWRKRARRVELVKVFQE